MKLNEYVHKYRTEHGLSQRALAKQCSLSSGYISLIEKGTNPQTGEPLTPTLPVLKKLATGMAITLTDLMTQVDDFPLDLSDDIPSAANIQAMPGTHQIPRLGQIACGVPILAAQNLEGYDSCPDWVHADFTLVCKGDSMVGAGIHDGDIVFVRQQAEVEPGQIAAVLIGDEATLKRVRPFPGGVMLLPENPDYEPMVFAGEDAQKVRIIGLATHYIGRVV